MRIITERVLKDGRRQLLIELGKNEPNPVPPLKVDQFYKLGYPCDEIVGGHILTEAIPVSWCSASQSWVSS